MPILISIFGTAIFGTLLFPLSLFVRGIEWLLGNILGLPFISG